MNLKDDIYVAVGFFGVGVLGYFLTQILMQVVADLARGAGH